MSKELPAERELDIAVIGLACRLPKSPDPQAFWRNLRDGVECISFFDADDLRASGVSPELLRDPSYVPAGGALDRVEDFDAEFFGYLPREAALLDPQQRLFLECSWQALESAGYRPGRPRAGVFAGATMNTYLTHLVLRDPGIIEKFGEQGLMLGNDKDFLPMRVSFKLGLTGPSVNVQAACATSLVAIHYACRSLQSGECDLALAGGASVRVPHRAGYWYREGGTASPDGHCRAFDAHANGSVPGSGAGVVVLKRYADALRDGDRIRAVVKGSGISNDGSEKTSFTAPSAEGQTRAILDAFLSAGLEADTLSYVECHGTATRLGDPIEVDGIRRAFREMTSRKQFCSLGSVKPNIGHLDAGAGVAGLIKTVLALEHELIPPTVHFQEPNPELHLEDSPFTIAGRAREWKRGPEPRRAGINSIGMGGVNAHVLLEEGPDPQRTTSHRSWFVLPVSARSPAAMERASERLTQHVSENASEPALADIGFTLQTGRVEFPHRRAVVVSRDGWREALVRRAAPAAVGVERPAVVYLMPGQGTHYPGMGSALYRTEPTFRAELRRCVEIVSRAGGIDLQRLLIHEASDGAALGDTVVDQPAIFAVEWALARTLVEWGIAPDRLIGHSVGELVAAALADVMSLEDALTLVSERARLMQAAPQGAMAAVALGEAELRAELDDGICIAGVNAPGSCVVSGATQVIEAFVRRMSARDVTCKRMRVARAFHSPMMESAALDFERRVAQVALRPPQLPIYSTVTGKRLTPEQATDPAYWGSQIRQPVRFLAAVQAALEAGPVLAVECGPGQVLSTWVRQASPGVAVLSAMPRGGDEAGAEEQCLYQTVASAWERGIAVDWTAFQKHETRRRVPLPTYPFDGKRAWIEPAPIATPPVAAATAPAPATTAIAPQGAARSIPVDGATSTPGPRPAIGEADRAATSIEPTLLGAEISVYADRIVIRTGGGLTAVAQVGAAHDPSVTAPTPVATAPARVPASHAPAPTPARAHPDVVAADPKPPTSAGDLEEQIATIVEEMLGIAPLDRTARLVDLGVDSLLLTQILTRLRRAVSPQLSLSVLTERGSIAEIARFVRGELAAPPESLSCAVPTAAANVEANRDDALALLDQYSAEELDREMTAIEREDSIREPVIPIASAARPPKR